MLAPTMRAAKAVVQPASAAAAAPSLLRQLRFGGGGYKSKWYRVAGMDNWRHSQWDFNENNYHTVRKILKRYPENRKQSGILPLLHLVQEQEGGWIPLAAARKVAEICESAPRRVYECMSFYAMFKAQPSGKWAIEVCKTTPCMVRGSDTIISALEEELGIHLGETTPDGLIHLTTFECLGACVNAPMLTLISYRPDNYSYNYYEDLTPATAIKIVRQIQETGEPPAPGPQESERKLSVPKGGRTSLKLQYPPMGDGCDGGFSERLAVGFTHKPSPREIEDPVLPQLEEEDTQKK